MFIILFLRFTLQIQDKPLNIKKFNNIFFQYFILKKLGPNYPKII